MKHQATIAELRAKRRHDEIQAQSQENTQILLSELEEKAKSLLSELDRVKSLINSVSQLSEAQTGHLEVTSAMVKDSVEQARDEILNKPQKEVDLAPVVEAIASIPQLPDLSPLVDLAMREDRPEKDRWEFDVQRDQRGFIQKITAH